MEARSVRLVQSVATVARTLVLLTLGIAALGLTVRVVCWRVSTFAAIVMTNASIRAALGKPMYC